VQPLPERLAKAGKIEPTCKNPEDKISALIPPLHLNFAVFPGDRPAKREADSCSPSYVNPQFFTV